MRAPVAAVAVAFVVLATVAGVWLALDHRPPEWDHANHLERAVLCARDLAEGDVEAVLLRSSFYPPLVLCAAGLAWRLLPSDVAAAQAVVVAFLGLGMAATFVLGRRFAGDAGGVAAALVFATAPFVVTQTVRFQLDLPLAAVVAVALEVLLRTDSFTRRGWSVGAGLVLGLGMLTKPPFAVYVAPLALASVARVRRLGAAANVALTTSAAILVSLPWYGPRMLGLAEQIGNRSFRQAAEQGHPDPFSAAGLLYYPSTFALQVGAVGAVLFGIGLLVGLRRRVLPLVWMLAPLAVFLLIRNKNLRYTLPLVPAAAVVAGVGLSALGARGRTVALALVAVAGAVQVSAAAFGIPASARLLVAGFPLVLQSPPLRAEWPQRQVLAQVMRESGGVPATVSVVPNHPYFSVANFRYYAVHDGLPLRFTRAWDDEPIGVDYMILKSGDVGPEFTAAKPRRIAERLEADRFLAAVFPVVGEWRLPDGATGVLRARRLPADLDVPPAQLASEIEAAFLRRVPEVARDVDGLAVRLQYDRRLTTGRIARVEVTAATATIGELRRRRSTPLRVHDLALVLEDVVVNPLAAHEAGRLEPLDIGRVRLERARIDEADFQAFLGGQRAFRRMTLTLEDGALRLAVKQAGPDVYARVSLVSVPDRLFAVESVNVWLGGVPVPALLVDWVLRSFDPVPRLAARLPMPLEIGHVSISPAAIVIGPAGR